MQRTTTAVITIPTEEKHIIVFGAFSKIPVGSSSVAMPLLVAVEVFSAFDINCSGDAAAAVLP